MKTMAFCYFAACAAFACLAYGPSVCGAVAGFFGTAINAITDLTLPRSKR